MAETWSGEFYCVKCKEKREASGEVRVNDKGTRMAKAVCPVCGTNLNRILVGDTLTLELKPDALVTVRCGDITLTEGRMGRVGDRVAVRVAKHLRKPSTTFAMFEMAGGTGNPMEAQQ